MLASRYVFYTQESLKVLHVENKKKIIMIGTIALFSTSLLFQSDLSLAEEQIYSPVDPNQRVEPVEPTEPSSTTSSMEIAPIESSTTESTTQEQPEKQPQKKPEEKPMKRRKRFLDDSFFSNESNQFIALNSGSGGGDDGHGEAQLVETLRLLSGVAFYGRKK